MKLVNHHPLIACRAALVVLSAASVVGCAQQGSRDGEPETEPAGATEGTAASGMPRVFFIEPRDGDTVPAGVVQMRFGAENFIIEPVGEGEIHEGAGHLHIGFNTDCLPPGEIIPTADPWVHFGQAQMDFELRLEPGAYRLCLQVGDGEHRTLEADGMAELISITVE